MGNNMYRPQRPERPMRPQYPERPMRPEPRHETPSRPGSGMSCEELLRAVAEADFFAQDLKLYLDTHPDDTRAVEMFVEACRQYKACKAAFEECCYPLTACSSGQNGVWDWLDGCWAPFINS